MTKELFLYSKSKCTLCDALKSELDRINVAYHVILIDDDPELLHRYGARVPVLETGNTVICEGRINQDNISKFLHTV